jgi:nucleoside-diphosphate-sugar epimerase
LVFKNKRVVVTGGTGLIGRPLVEMLLERGAQVRIVSYAFRVKALIGGTCPKGAEKSVEV